MKKRAPINKPVLVKLTQFSYDHILKTSAMYAIPAATYVRMIVDKHIRNEILSDIGENDNQTMPPLRKVRNARSKKPESLERVAT